MRRIWSVLLPLALVACSENPVARGEDLVLAVQEAELAREGATVEAVQGGVSIHGVYVAGTSGYTLRAFVHQESDGDVLVNVGGYPPSGPAFQVITGLEYQATVSLPPGTRTVTVRHFGARDAGESQRTVASRRVTVTRL